MVCGGLAGVVQGVLRGLTFSDHLEGGALQAAKQGDGGVAEL